MRSAPYTDSSQGVTKASAFDIALARRFVGLIESINITTSTLHAALTYSNRTGRGYPRGSDRRDRNGSGGDLPGVCRTS